MIEPSGSHFSLLPELLGAQIEIVYPSLSASDILYLPYTRRGTQVAEGDGLLNR